MAKIVAIYASPRRKGNTASLLQQAVAGAREAGADVEEIVLRDLKISPCLEIYGCAKTGKCAIKDDFGLVLEKIEKADGLLIASPVFFYAVSAHLKILMDRCQSLWVKKNWVDKAPSTKNPAARKALFISVGATKGRKLFDGIMLSMRYFLDVLDATLFKTLLYRGMDFEGDVQKHPEYLTEAKAAGYELGRILAGGKIDA
jgi:multimeric flavodoxin WrbA